MLKPSRERPPLSGILPGILTGCAVMGLVVYALCFLYRSCLLIGFPYEADYGEPFVLNQARMISQGQLPYLPIESPPYCISNYPPFYPMVLAPFVKVFGLSFWYGRLLSTLASVGAGIVIGLLVWGTTARKLPAFIAGLSYLSVYYVYDWGMLFRVDALAVFLSILGLLAIDRGFRMRVYLPLFILSFFTRQTMVAAPLTAFCFLWFNERRREARLFGTGFILCNVLVAAVLAMLTHGEFLRHTIIYNANPYELKTVLYFLLHMARYSAFFFALGAFYLFFMIGEQRRGLLFNFLIFSFLSGLLSGKVGSASNYWLEFMCALSWALGLSWAEWTEHPGKVGRALRILFPIMLLFQAFNNFHFPNTRYDYAQTPEKTWWVQDKTLFRYVQDSAGPVLCEDGTLPLFLGKEMLFQPFEIKQLIQAGLWNQAPLLESIDGQRFDFLILSSNIANVPSDTEFFTKEFYQTARANYVLSKQIGGSFIHVPLSRSVVIVQD